MKQVVWPTDGKPASFEELCGPIKAALRHAYKMRRKPLKDIPWRGPALALACDFPPAEKLKAENLEFAREGQGRDALDTIIGIALQIGIEQGRRIEVSEHGDLKDLTTRLAAALSTLEPAKDGER